VSRRIKHNNLLPWFTQDHGTLPASYLRSCKKFFKELSNKPQASSVKQQALDIMGFYGKKIIERK